MSKSDVPRIGRRKPFRLFIHEWMKHKGVNQVDLANRLEVGSSGTISKKLKNPEKMSVEWLAAIAHALDVEVDQLYHHPDKPRPEDLFKDMDEPTRAVVIQMIRGAKRA